MERTSLLVIALVSACGGTASGVDNDRDAAIDTPADDALPDAPADAPPAAVCDPSKPWGTPTPVTNVNTVSRDFQAMVAEPLTAYLATDRAGTIDLYTATRASVTSAWDPATSLPGFTTNGAETSPYATADNLTLFYAFTAQGSSLADIYVTTRANTNVAFTAGAAVANINGVNDDDGDVVVTGNGNTMFFASNRNGGVYHLYTAVKGVSGSFGAATAVTELNSAVYDAHPRVSEDGLIMYFSSMRTGTGTLGGTDIWRATRPSVAAVWSAPTLVTQLNTVSNESPTYISNDDCYFLMQTDRAGGTGLQDIWEAKRPP